jgi:hypothetical protein
MKRLMKKIQNKQYGQAMVEFALTLPIFLLAVIGVIELSRFFLVYSSVYTASREAARYGSSVGEDTNLPNYMNCSEIASRAQDMGFFGGVNAGEVVVYYEKEPNSSEANQIPCDGVYNPELGDRLVVNVSADYIPLIAGFVLPEGIIVSANNGRTIMKEIKLLATPLPVPLCEDDIMFDGTLTNEPNNKTYTVKVKNISKTGIYQLSAVEIISFNEKKDLAKIYWNNTLIWENKEGEEFPVIDPDAWEDVKDADGNIIFSRFLSSEQTIPIKFEFLKVINKSQLGLNFKLTFQNTSRMSQSCVLSWP